MTVYKISKLWKVLGESNINNTLIKAQQNLYGNRVQEKIGNKLSPITVIMAPKHVTVAYHFNSKQRFDTYSLTVYSAIRNKSINIG
jgi:hypothetical protein